MSLKQNSNSGDKSASSDVHRPILSGSDNVCSAESSDSDSGSDSDSFRHGVRGRRTCGNGVCGKAFYAKPSAVANGRGRYCSVTCARSVQAKLQHARRPQTGSANPNFKNWSSRNKRQYVDRFRAKYPEKAAAHDAVRDALQSGRLVRPATCERCGSMKPLHAHHDDYSLPLAVVFACRDCHRHLDSVRHSREAMVS